MLLWFSSFIPFFSSILFFPLILFLLPFLALRDIRKKEIGFLIPSNTECTQTNFSTNSPPSFLPGLPRRSFNHLLTHPIRFSLVPSLSLSLSVLRISVFTSQDSSFIILISPRGNSLSFSPNPNTSPFFFLFFPLQKLSSTWKQLRVKSGKNNGNWTIQKWAHIFWKLIATKVRQGSKYGSHSMSWIKAEIFATVWCLAKWTLNTEYFFNSSKKTRHSDHDYYVLVCCSLSHLWEWRRISEKVARGHLDRCSFIPSFIPTSSCPLYLWLYIQ